MGPAARSRLWRSLLAVWLSMVVAVLVAVGFFAYSIISLSTDDGSAFGHISALPPSTTTTEPATTTQPPSTTTTEPPTTTTTLPPRIPCTPARCAFQNRAATDNANYKWRGIRGALGWLDLSPEERLEDSVVQWSTFAGIVRGYTYEPMPGPFGEDVQWLVGEFYFGDHPVTGENIVARFLLGPENEPFQIYWSSNCNTWGRGCSVDTMGNLGLSYSAAELMVEVPVGEAFPLNVPYQLNLQLPEYVDSCTRHQENWVCYLLQWGEAQFREYVLSLTTMIEGTAEFIDLSSVNLGFGPPAEVRAFKPQL